ncbi:PBSX phage terminase large subunit [Fibrella aestuarina BUZ 2]|uniref:PBSX phage terminase large subunit n=1 Tax=Fibrella aestuarina BUZ 2 TaxID=1166018 RepID=I0K6V5_9BACT|nr:PBSX family phage terminase large subunit [Fibrella aestuarina]CCG99858.1 PBSX phage terminase large subunit [Fibrella aestuarina BUZ 2]
MRKLHLSAKLFTTAYRKFRAVVQQLYRYVVFFGAADSSKSYSAHQDIVLDLMTAKADILVMRKQASHIRESCYKLLKAIILAWGLTTSFDFFYSSDKREIVFKPTGRKIVFMGVNDPESLKSLFGFYRVLIEEANQLEWGDFLEIDRRARSEQFIQIILLLNPVSESHWIKSKLIDDAAYAGQVGSCHVTYRDNEYITPERIAALERLKDVDPYQYRVYVLGLWGIIRPDNPYFHKINPTVHFGKVVYNPRIPVYCSFDFNKINSVTLRQKPVINGVEVPQFFREIHQGGEGLDLEYICKEIAHTYGRSNQLHITGDASGGASNALTPGNRSAWRLTQTYMSQYGAHYTNYQVPKANPHTDDARFVVNALIHHYGDDFKIDDKACPVLAADVQRCKTATDGKLDKDDCNKFDYGHLSDCGRYDLCNFEYTTFRSLGHYKKAA